MDLFTNSHKDGSSYEVTHSFFDPSLATNFKVDDEENVITFDYDFGECGNSLNLPCVAALQSVKFIVKVTASDIHISVLATYDTAKCRVGYLADECGVVEFNARLDDGIERDEQKLMFCYIITNLLNK